MMRTTICVVLVAVCLAGQLLDNDPAVLELRSSLTALNNDGATNSPHRQRITTAIMSASEQQHRPSAPKVGALTNELVSTLSGRRLSETQVSELSTAIISVLRSAGKGTHALYAIGCAGREGTCLWWRACGRGTKGTSDVNRRRQRS